MSGTINFDKASSAGDRYNPASTHLKGREAEELLESLREQAAAVFQVKPGSLSFCPNATYANNLAILGSNCAYVAVDSGDHSSITGPAQMLKAADLKSLSTAADAPIIVSVSAVSGETGMVTDLRSLRKQIDALNLNRQSKIILHVDGSQAMYVYSPATIAKYSDISTLALGKYGGPSTAIFYKKFGVPVKPILYGGNQENGLVPGTPDTYGIEQCVHRLKRTVKLKPELLEQKQTILESGLKRMGCDIVLKDSQRSPHITRVILRDSEGGLVDNETLQYKLEARGFMVGLGTACQAKAALPNQALKNLGYSDDEARSSLRISYDNQNDLSDIEDLLLTLGKVLEHKR